MLKKNFLIVLVALMIFFSDVSAIYLSAGAIHFQAAGEDLSGSGLPEIEEIENQGFVCRLSGQSDADAQRILDLLNDGFVGENISSGEDPPEKREFLDNNNLFIPLDEETAVKAEVASGKIEPREIQHLFGDSFSGPYSIGMVLDDTLRLGRCEGLTDKNQPCPVTEKSLQLRNDGEGFSGDFKSAWNAIKDAIPELKDKEVSEITQEEYTQIRESLGLPKDSEELLSENLAILDENADDSLVSVKRKVGPMISNSILATNFEALSRTDCSSSDCTISLYSLFDKYYNALFTAEVVISTGFPTLLYRAKKLIRLPALDGLSPWKISESQMMKSLRARFLNPESLLGARRISQIQNRGYKFPEVGELKSELFEPRGFTQGYTLTKGSAFRKWWTEKASTKDGILDRASKDPKIQEEMYRFVNDVRGFSTTQKNLFEISQKDYGKVLNKYGFGSAQEVAARIDHARTTSGLIKQWDDAFDLDTLELLSRDYGPGLYPYFVQTPDGSFQWISADSVYIRNIVKKFQRDGHWGGTWGTEFDQVLTTKGRNMQMFQPEVQQKIADIGPSELDNAISRYKEKFIKLDSGTVLPINEQTMPLIKENVTGSAEVFDAGWAPTLEMTPEDFSSRILNQRVELNTFILPKKNSEIMYNTLVDRGFTRRRYFNLLDRAMSRQQDLLKDYFSLRGGLKWTGITYTYWWLKRAEVPGSGFLEGDVSRKISGYMLPEDWIQITWPVGEGDLYADAFIDFLANSGSDDGDLMRRFVNSLPWDSVAYRNATKAFNIADEQYDKFTGRGNRTIVKNLGFYTSASEDCVDCGVTFTNGSRINSFSVSMYSEGETNNFVVEDSKPTEEGSLLIAFSRHTDVAGRKKSEAGNTAVSLSEALSNGESCAEKVINTVSGIPAIGGALTYLTEDRLRASPAAIGGLLAFGESLGYVLFGFSGIFGSVYQQLALVPEFQECVDISGGYFTHIYAPPKPENQGNVLTNLLGPITSEEPGEQATDSLGSMFDGLSGSLDAVISGDSNTPISEGLEDIKGQTEELFDSANDQYIVEAIVKTNGFSSGKLESTNLFSFWFKGETTPESYKVDGKKQVNAKDQNFSVFFDFEDGIAYKIDEEGNKIAIIENEDIVRLTSTNTNMPAEEIPKRLAYLGLPNSKILMFEAKTDSELLVHNQEVMDCIRQAVLDQSGVPLTEADKVTQAFGLVKEISTDTHKTVKIFQETNRIVAEGTPRRLAEGKNAAVKLYANREVELVNGTTKEIGLLNSVVMENGVFIVKPETRELIIWLKRNARVSLEQQEVNGINVGESESFNPLTQCTEPAFTLDALARQGSDFIDLKVDQFNTSLDALGPFQVFDTPSRRFSFFSKNENGSCVDYFKIYNKETGESYEAPITSLTVGPNGLEITDGFGQNHNLEFSAQDGIPRISYNNQPAETLTVAQGRNGAFWFDPQTGRWYTENASLLPLIEAFRKGSLTQTGIGDVVISGPGGNVFNIGNTGGLQSGPFNLPSLPENPLMLVIYITTLLGAIVVIRSNLK